MPYGKKRNYARMAKKAVRKPKANGIKVSKPVINPVLKKYVSKLVNKTEEIKVFTNGLATKYNIQGSGFNTTGPFGFNSPSNIIPIISQGTGQHQRVGNVIRPKGKLYIRGHVVALPTSSTNNPFPNCPFYVKIVVWRQKASMSTISNTDILDNGITAGGINFDGTLDDLMIPFNRDKYVIGAVKTFSLQPNSTVSGYSTENLSRFPVSKFFKMYVDLPAKLTYNDTLLDPSNCRWYMSAGIVNCDGTLAINSIYRAQITADATMRFTDA